MTVPVVSPPLSERPRPLAGLLALGGGQASVIRAVGAADLPGPSSVTHEDAEAPRGCDEVAGPVWVRADRPSNEGAGGPSLKRASHCHLAGPVPVSAIMSSRAQLRTQARRSEGSCPKLHGLCVGETGVETGGAPRGRGSSGTHRQGPARL